MQFGNILELQEEKNIVLKEINETLNKIHVTLQEINNESLHFNNTADVDKLKNQLIILKRMLIPQEDGNISRRHTDRTTGTTTGKSVQIIEHSTDSD